MLAVNAVNAEDVEAARAAGTPQNVIDRCKRRAAARVVVDRPGT